MKRKYILPIISLLIMLVPLMSCKINKQTSTTNKETINQNILPSENLKIVKGVVSEEKYNNDEIYNEGCSWYCGVGVGEPTSSSMYKIENNISYAPQNANDGNLKTAWIEGASGYGVGEYITYELVSGVSNAILKEVELFNGYRKNDKLWNDNSRVKKLKMYIDDKPYALLEVVDTKELQTFNVGSFKLIEGKPIKIKLEIIDVYKGLKYEDTAITDIAFSGGGVH